MSCLNCKLKKKLVGQMHIFYAFVPSIAVKENALGKSAEN